MASTETKTLREWMRIHAEAQVERGAGQRTKLFRVHRDNDSVKCECGFSIECSLCYGSGVISPYRVVEEAIVEKSTHDDFNTAETPHFVFSHNETLIAGDVFYWHDPKEPESKPFPYHIVGRRATSQRLGITEAVCRLIPSHTALCKYPLEEAL